MMRQSQTATASSAEKLYVASQWQLIRWKFLKHKLAVVALVVLAMFYLTVVFAEIIAPYDPRQEHLDHIYVPPQKIRFCRPVRWFATAPLCVCTEVLGRRGYAGHQV